MSAPTTYPFAPVWLSPDDVKSWLRLQGQDTSDDELILAACAMTEPYVERCRPEWRIPVVPYAAIRADIRSGTGVMNLAVEEWQAANGNDMTIVNGNAHVVAVVADNHDNWGSVLPATQATFSATAGTLVSGKVIDGDAAPITSASVVHWVTHRVLVALQYTAGEPPTMTGIDRLPTYVPDAETYQGARMYAAREYRRRNSPSGIETFGEATSFVARFDPDIDRALQTGPFARPVIA